MNKLESLQSIFKDSVFKIPDYQRGCAWKKEQLTDFWEDIVNLPEKSERYTGMLSPKIASDVKRETTIKSFAQKYLITHTSRGDIDEIDPDDIVYGEYSGDHSNLRNWIDLVYLDGDLLLTFSGPVSPLHQVIQKLQVLLRAEDMFYLIPVKEVPLGFAFKRTDIVDIKSTTLIEGNNFTYGNTIRPKSMTNVSILDKVFQESNKE